MWQEQRGKAPLGQHNTGAKPAEFSKPASVTADRIMMPGSAVVEKENKASENLTVRRCVPLDSRRMFHSVGPQTISVRFVEPCAVHTESISTVTLVNFGFVVSGDACFLVWRVQASPSLAAAFPHRVHRLAGHRFS